MRSLTDAFAHALRGRSWSELARPAQLPPPGDWRIWVLLAGRGAGKTRSGAEYVTAEVMAGRARHVAVVGRTAADVRDVMVEGPSGLLTIAPGYFRPVYEPSKRRLTWPNGAVATTFSADEPDLLRGPQHDLAWCDELAAWERAQETWDNLMLGLRLGQARCVISTTPRPIPLIRQLVARHGQDVRITRMTTFENLPNLAPGFAEDIVSKIQRDAPGTAGAVRGDPHQYARGAVVARDAGEDARGETADETCAARGRSVGRGPQLSAHRGWRGPVREREW